MWLIRKSAASTNANIKWNFISQICQLIPPKHLDRKYVIMPSIGWSAALTTSDFKSSTGKRAVNANVVTHRHVRDVLSHVQLNCSRSVELVIKLFYTFRQLSSTSSAALTKPHDIWHCLCVSSITSDLLVVEKSMWPYFNRWHCTASTICSTDVSWLQNLLFLDHVCAAWEFILFAAAAT